jgi:UPF0716 family protein affecting phage T7 exclusion
MSNIALAICLLSLGAILLIFHKRIASFWTWQQGGSMPSGVDYAMRYLLGPALIVVAGILVLVGVLK